MPASRPLRIALVHYTIPPVIGGVENVIADQWKIFRQFGHQAELFDGEGFHARFDPADYDLLIAHNVLTMPFDLKLTCCIWELADQFPVINWVHDVAACNQDYDIPSRMPHDLLRRAHPQMTHVAISMERRQAWEKLTGAGALVVPNGLHLAATLGLTTPVKNFVDQFSILSRQLILFYPTRLIPRKQIERAIQITGCLRQIGVDALLLCTGAHDPHQASAQSYARQLRELAKAEQLQEAVLFLQDYFPVHDADMASLYHVSDALLLTTRQEGFGLPLLEAALHRLPAFCPAIEPLCSIIHILEGTFPEAISPGEGGLVYPSEATAGEIAALLWERMRTDRVYLRRKKLISHFSWEVLMATHIEPLLLQAANPGKMPFKCKLQGD